MTAAVAHLFGDYVVQSDWMASRKTAEHLPAAAHALTYAACFVPLTRSPRALAVIAGTHFVIDRWRLARHVVWVKNQAVPAEHRYPWDHAMATGYHTHTGLSARARATLPCNGDDKPIWMAVWLMILADNAMHMAINEWALSRWPA